MVGSLATSFLIELIVHPILYEQWKSRTLTGGVLAPISITMRRADLDCIQ
jgi:hypothetical protein